MEAKFTVKVVTASGDGLHQRYYNVKEEPRIIADGKILFIRRTGDGDNEGVHFPLCKVERWEVDRVGRT